MPRNQQILLDNRPQGEATAGNFRLVASDTPALQDGQVSKPFRTQAGWHVVQRVGTRQANVGDQNRRAQVAEMLGREHRVGELVERFGVHLLDRLDEVVETDGAGNRIGCGGVCGFSRCSHASTVG